MSKVARVRCSAELREIVLFIGSLTSGDLEVARALSDGGFWMKKSATVVSMRPDLLRKRFHTLIKKFTDQFPMADFKRLAVDIRQVSYDQSSAVARAAGVGDGFGPD